MLNNINVCVDKVVVEEKKEFVAIIFYLEGMVVL